MNIQSRSQLGELLKVLDLKKDIAEIGVAEGNFSSTLITYMAPMLYLVDRWESVPEQYGDSAFGQEWHDTNYNKVLQRIDAHKERCTILKGDSVQVADNVPDNSLSLIYLDADHTYEGVKRDIETWYDKVEEGGIIAGHDYLNADYGVYKAINEFVNGRFDIVTISENEPNNASFYFIKHQKTITTMSATCYFSGRLGNCFYNIAMLVAYCKKHGLQYYIPSNAIAYNHFGMSTDNPLPVMSTGPSPVNPIRYQEPNMATGHPYYHDIPRMENVLFDGYFQSFKYFNDYRADILAAFNMSNNTEWGVTSITVRRGDNVGSEAFMMAPRAYYQRAIMYMQKKGYHKFRIYSDDIPWCKEEFVDNNYPHAIFEFSKGVEKEDYEGIVQCENNICAISTFSLSAAWLNQNAGKIVLVPQENMWWKGQNRNLLTDSGFIQIYYPQEYNKNMMKYTYTYKDINFRLIIQNYWKDIYRGKEQEPLYADYCKMLDIVQTINKERYILDVGVNHGIFAVPCSLLGYKVVGFEPVERNFNSVQLAMIENRLEDFHLYNAALSDVDNVLEIFVPECSDNASFNKEVSVANMIRKDYTAEIVKSVKFDNWIEGHNNFKDVGLIKLDVQGYEYKVIEGMKEYLLQASDITIICEYEHHLNTMGYSFQQMDDLFYSLGFEYVKHLTSNDKMFYKK